MSETPDKDKKTTGAGTSVLSKVPPALRTDAAAGVRAAAEARIAIVRRP